jgi:hypothetical protein
MNVRHYGMSKKRSSGTTAAIHLPATLRDKIDEAAQKSGLSKQDFYRLCIEIGMIFWKEAGSVASALHLAGKNRKSLEKVRNVCSEYGLIPQDFVDPVRVMKTQDVRNPLRKL